MPLELGFGRVESETSASQPRPPFSSRDLPEYIADCLVDPEAQG